jgi:hypothetical protein
VEQAGRSSPGVELECGISTEWSGISTVGAVDGARVAPPLFDRGTVAGGRYRADTSGLG